MDLIVTRDKSFYRSYLAVFWPLVLQQVITLGVNTADNIMLGSLTAAGTAEAALAGAASVNQISTILGGTIAGVASGLTVLGAQYWGQKQLGAIRRLAAIAFWIAVGISAAVSIACFAVPADIVRLFIADESAVAEGVKYLGILRYSFIIFAVNQILIASLNCVEKVKLAFWVSLMTFAINIPLNWLMIPVYGSAGAAFATLASHVITCLFMLVYTFIADKKLSLRPRHLISFDRVLAVDFIKVAYPVVAISCMWGFSNALSSAILGHMAMSKAVVAAYSASHTLYTLFKSGAQGASNSAAIIMAKTVGSGNFEKVKEYARTMQFIFIALGVIMSSLLFLAKDIVLAQYELTEESFALAHSFMNVLCICSIGMSYQMPTVTGIIRGGGDTRFGMFNDLISIWCIVLPLSALAAYVWKLPAVVVVAILNSDQIFKCLPAAWRCNRFRWVKKLTRDNV